MMLALARFLFVVMFIFHLCTANTIAFAADQAAKEAAKDVVNENNIKLFSIIGQVVHVLSGDAIEVLLPDGELISVQLAGIKSPSPEDPIGIKSHAWLNGQLKEELISAECVELDELLHCEVYPDDRNINLVSLYHGLSRRNGNKNPVINELDYRSAERHARDSKVGLWNSGYRSAELE